MTPNSREGLQYLDSLFFEARSKTKTKCNMSWYEAQKNPEILQKLNQVAERLNSNLYQAYQLWYGTVNQFKPSVAKFIYERYCPDTVLDFCAGWGGRCLGAIHRAVPYIGIDTNTDLKEGYEALKRNEPDAEFVIHYQPAETFDFSSVKYDMIFTSPPYFCIEKYEHMPLYDSKEDFLARFFYPVIEGAWASLTEGGHMVLNMPEEMYFCIKDMLPPIKETLMMPIGNRFSKFSNVKRAELIYVWEKEIPLIRAEKIVEPSE